MEKGTQVLVIFKDKRYNGTYEGTEDIKVIDGNEEVLFTLKDCPVLKLENEEIVYGFECWWTVK